MTTVFEGPWVFSCLLQPETDVGDAEGSDVALEQLKVRIRLCLLACLFVCLFVLFCLFCLFCLFVCLLFVLCVCLFVCLFVWADGLAEWLERWVEDRKVEGSNPVNSARKTEFFRVKKVVLTPCRCARSNPRVYTHAHKRPLYAR